jgi:hypothetical protein
MEKQSSPKLTPEQIQVIVNWINAGALNNYNAKERSCDRSFYDIFRDMQSFLNQPKLYIMYNHGIE